MHKNKAVLTLEISWPSSRGRDKVLGIGGGGGYFISFRCLFLLNPCSVMSSYLFSSSIFHCTKEMCVFGVGWEDTEIYVSFHQAGQLRLVIALG